MNNNDNNVFRSLRGATHAKSINTIRRERNGILSRIQNLKKLKLKVRPDEFSILVNDIENLAAGFDEDLTDIINSRESDWINKNDPELLEYIRQLKQILRDFKQAIKQNGIILEKH